MQEIPIKSHYSK